MAVPERARLVRIPLDGEVSAAEACLLVRGDARPFALVGAWAGGGALVGSEPVAVGKRSEDPFDLLDRQPELDATPCPSGGAVGGGWFGYLGYGLGARLEPVPPSPPRPVPLPAFALAFYDHLVRLDAGGRWWFEALWSDEREPALQSRLELLGRRLAHGVRRLPARVRTLAPTPPSGVGAPRRGGGVQGADRRRRDLPGEPVPADGGQLGRRRVRPVRRRGGRARAGVRGRSRGRVGCGLQPLARAVPAPPGPRGDVGADQGHGAAHAGRRRSSSRSRPRIARRT